MVRRSKTPAGRPSRVRIIGGRWRGRHLPVVDATGLRPTKDIIRETLFNWLAPSLEGSCCLDAFAGSGALGFEAASRGAASVLMLENNAVLCSGLQEQARGLDAENVDVICADALEYLRGGVRLPAPFDAVFLDPPFNRDLSELACQRLAEGNWLAPTARVYIEIAKSSGWPELPSGWQWLRQKTAGDVAYGLAAAAG